MGTWGTIGSVLGNLSFVSFTISFSLPFYLRIPVDSAFITLVEVLLIVAYDSLVH